MTKLKTISLALVVLTALLYCGALAQENLAPLTLEGLNHQTNSSVLSRSMGGVTIPLQKDVSLMFANPTNLSTLEKFTISIGSTRTTTVASQTQQWQPDVYWGNFTLLMDGSSRGIDSSLVPHTWPTSRFPGDTLWKPYDNIGSNWGHNRDAGSLMPEVFVGLPLTIGGMNAAVGVGFSKYAKMDYYYQNNNVLSPEYDLIMVGQGVVKGDSLKRLDWSQAIRQREGDLYGYGGAFSMNITEKFSAGVSARYIAGSTDDYESTLGRGVLWFYSSGLTNKIWNVNQNSMRLDTAQYTTIVTGTSDYTGLDATVSAAYRGKNATIGVSFTLPSTITRKFTGTVVSDAKKSKVQAAGHSESAVSSTQDMSLPYKAKLGLGWQVRSNVMIAAEYEYIPYSKSELDNNGAVSKPWMDASSFHFGLNWQPSDVMSLRFGYRRQDDVFKAQYAAFDNAPESYVAYSGGLGINLMQGLALNVAYEYYRFKYADVWVDNSNVNSLISNTISAELSYSLH